MDDFFLQHLLNLSRNNLTPEDRLSFCRNNIEKYPAHFYKFRPGKEQYDFDMIRNEYLYASSADTFLDKTDSIVRINVSTKAYQDLMIYMIEHVNQINFFLCQKNNMPFSRTRRFNNAMKEELKDEVLNNPPPEEFCEEIANMLFSNSPLSKCDKRNLSKAVNSIIPSDCMPPAKKMIFDFVHGFQDRMNICCLTTDIKSQKMWEDYADKYSGFAIEYDTLLALKDSSLACVLSEIFPVSYSEKMPHIDPIVIADAVAKSFSENKSKDYNNFGLQLLPQLFTKKMEYSCEKEWRLARRKSDSQIIDFPCISAIYMGRDISEESKAKLIDICQTKKIRLFQQRTCEYTGELKYDEVKYEG